jgi:hypothetical protein
MLQSRKVLEIVVVVFGVCGRFVCGDSVLARTVDPTGQESSSSRMLNTSSLLSGSTESLGNKYHDGQQQSIAMIESTTSATTKETHKILVQGSKDTQRLTKSTNSKKVKSLKVSKIKYEKL